jgi:hypothetical protein
MVKVLAPMLVKLLFRLWRMASMAVRMPTSVEMPTAMMRMVRMVRSRLLRMAPRAMRMFSSTRDFMPQSYQKQRGWPRFYHGLFHYFWPHAIC